MRLLLVKQTDLFIEMYTEGKSLSERKITLSIFKDWLKIYPFIRLYIIESLMPRMWTLRPIDLLEKVMKHTLQPDG